MAANGVLVFTCSDPPVPVPVVIDDGKVGCITCEHRGHPSTMVKVCFVSEEEHEHQCGPCRYGL